MAPGASTTGPALTGAQVVDRWSHGPVVAASCEPVHRRIGAVAARRPDALAVADPRTTTTFGELDARANRLAHELRAWGVAPGARVALLAERSVEYVVAELAVLRAGAAYVPLDPASPVERLRGMLADAAPVALLAQPALLPSCPDGPWRTVALDACEELAAGRPASPPPGGAGLDDAAYVIFTSGSTGAPKGVEVPHAALANLVDWHVRSYGVGPQDRSTFLAAPAFDGTVWELWPYLTAGASVHVPGADDLATAPRIVRWISETGLTLAFLPTPLAELVMAEPWPAGSRLRWLLTGGDRLRRRPPADLPFTIVNHYGPTECTVLSTAWTVEPAQDGVEGDPPIGRPVANTSVYVLDAQGAPVGVGVAGELCLGGVQVARGYVGRRGLTAERFVPDPFAGAGARMYRTGDLARWRAGGVLEFLGRSDDQVKVRGFRVELGEVEAALLACPQVGDAVVAARADGGGGLRLVGYVVGRGGVVVDVAGVRERLAAVLPAYMVPAALVVVEALPLTPSGKVDRAALPAPGPVAGVGVVAPHDDVEAALAGLWEELLGVGPVGVTDDFFALGGTSLQVIRLMGRLADRFGRELPFDTIFRGPTIAALARAVRAGTRTPPSPLVPLRLRGERPPLVCFPPAVGTALCYLDLVRALPEGSPVHGVHAPGLDGDRPAGGVAELVGRYAGAIEDAWPSGPVLLAGYCIGSVLAVEVARALRDRGREIPLVALLDGGPPSPGGGLGDADLAEVAAWFALELARAAGRDLDVPAEALRGRGDDGVVQQLWERAVAADVLPPDTRASQVRAMLDVFVANVRAVTAHRLAPFDGPVVAFAAADGPGASPVERWRPLVADDLRVVRVPGDHYAMLRPPHVAALAAALDGELRSAIGVVAASTPVPEQVAAGQPDRP